MDKFIFDEQLTQLREQKWTTDTVPLVSICCLTYNHEKYVRDAIEGFLMQKTDFPVEILIHDDASTDNTARIIKEYEIKYPHLIKPIYQRENQFSQGKKPGIINRKRAKGKYIAYCEGDDYWIDPYKLKKQVEFLEQNPNYSMCFHNARVENYRNKESFSELFAPIENKEYSIQHLLEKWLIPTASVMFRRSITIPDSYLKYHVGDLPIFLFLAHHGKIYGSSDVMCVYRKINNSMTHKMTEKEITFKKKYIEMFQSLDSYFAFQYHPHFKKVIGRYYLYLASAYIKQGKHLKAVKPLLKSTRLNPRYVATLLSSKMQRNTQNH